MKYFLTGATGFIGKRVAQQLVQANHEVIAIVRNPTRAKDLADLGVTLHSGDITNKESMRVPMQGVDGICHIAGWYKIGASAKAKAEGEQINVLGTKNVLEVMQELQIPKGVYTSTLAVFSDTGGRLVDETYRFNGEHLSEYDRTKWVAHYEVADRMVAAGLPLVMVQPGLVYGPGDTSNARTTFVQYLQRQLPMIPSQTAYSWAHVDDIARAHILAMAKGQPGESYIIGGPAHTLVEALEIAEEITGIPAPKIKASPAMMKAMSSLMGVVGKIAPLPEMYDPELLRILAGVTYIGDNSKAKRELGYDPRSLKEGLTETLHYEMKLLGMRSPSIG
jgi:nucleoside-diphosphate-sugar epimerase